MAVYFIQHGEGGAIKIGTTSRDPFARMARLQTGAPLPMRMLIVIPGGPEEERALHERFAALHDRGEWFRPDPRLLGFIEGLQWAHSDPRWERATRPRPAVSESAEPAVAQAPHEVAKGARACLAAILGADSDHVIERPSRRGP